jgi:hypothetical protein
MRDKQARESFFFTPFFKQGTDFSGFLGKEKLCEGDLTAYFTGMIMIDR